MTTTAEVTESAREAGRDPRGDIARVRCEIVRGLSEVVTEAAHQAAMYVYDWRHGAERGAALPGPVDALAHAEECLTTATRYLTQLRAEVGQCQGDRWDAELPF